MSGDRLSGDRLSGDRLSGDRLDKRVARMLDTSRAEAQRIIRLGHVQVDARIMTKPGAWVAETVPITVNGGRRPFVGRGGEKLDAALTHFNIDVTGRVCLDVGASTGGFTDCLLQRGAARVYAVENGTGQLAASLQADERVILFEQTDIRQVTPALYGHECPPDMAVVDVSFISLTKVLAPVRKLLAEGGELVCLIKPQYEAGPGRVNKRGVLRGETPRREAVAQVTAFAQSLGFTPIGVIPSPVESANKEYLGYFTLSYTKKGKDHVNQESKNAGRET